MIIITGANEVIDTINTQEIDAVLSIEHPGSEDGKGRAPRLIDYNLGHIPQDIVCFWDVNSETATNGPSSEIVKQAFAFLDTHTDKNILVHCKAGRSRSVALSLGWLAKQDGIQPAIDYIKSIRPQAAPNLAVIDIIDREYGFNGALSSASRSDPDFAHNNAHVEKRREEYARRNPELLKTIYPEKFNLG
jgi:predicted protein tyrosine phosphatase